MIEMNTEARMICEDEGCGIALTVKLVLTLSGGFAFKPPIGHGWQITAANGMFLSRCPEHRKLIEGEAPRLELIQ